MSILTQDSLYAGRTQRIGLVLAFVSFFGFGWAGRLTKELGHPAAARALLILAVSVPVVVLVVAILLRRRRLRAGHRDLDGELAHFLRSLEGELATARARARRPELRIYQDWRRRLVSLRIAHPDLARIEELLDRAERELREEPMLRDSNQLDEAAENLGVFWSAVTHSRSRPDTVARLAWGASLLALFVALYSTNVPLGVVAIATNWVSVMVLLRAHSIIVMAGGGFILACFGFGATILAWGSKELVRIWFG
jgi:hypothetical protein